IIKVNPVFNSCRKLKLSSSTSPTVETQQPTIREAFHLVSKGSGNIHNFLQGRLFIRRSDNKLIYRLYATLYLSSVWIPQQAYLAFFDLT
ncbi:AP-3 complex subunit sigma-1, partial [Lemmus lemmus]